jgi:hypothetical protein
MLKFYGKYFKIIHTLDIQSVFGGMVKFAKALIAVFFLLMAVALIVPNTNKTVEGTVDSVELGRNIFGKPVWLIKLEGDEVVYSCDLVTVCPRLIKYDSLLINYRSGFVVRSVEVNRP